MADFIGVEIFGAKELAARLKKLPAAVIDAGSDEANKWLLGILKTTTYPRKRSIPRRVAYAHLSATTPLGNTIIGYSSWKQFKFVMALVGSGKVPYSRTSTFKNSWQIIGKGKDAIIVNETPYGKFLMGDGEQSSGPRLIGWKMLSVVMKEREKGVVTKFEAGMKKGAAKVGIEMK